MRKKEPIVVKGHHIIQLLSSVSDTTLFSIREDLGDETFVNTDLVKLVEKALLIRKEKKVLENLETISTEEPDFWC